MSALPPLALSTDIVAQLGRPLDATETLKVDGLLRLASSKVRAYTRQDFSQSQTTVNLRSVSAQVKPPQRPVVSVQSVQAILRNGQLVVLPLWYFDGIDTIGGVAVADDVVINLPSWYTTWWTGSVQVQYTHGYTTVPTDIVDIVAAMVFRIFNAPGSGATGIASERVGQFYQYQINPNFPSGEVIISDDDKGILNRYRQNTRTIELR
jgi:hypothetical protein